MGTTTFKFDRKTERTIARLKAWCGASSKAEVVRLALALLDLAREAREANNRIAIVQGGDVRDGVSPILIPGFDPVDTGSE